MQGKVLLLLINKELTPQLKGSYPLPPGPMFPASQAAGSIRDSMGHPPPCVQYRHCCRIGLYLTHCGSGLSLGQLPVCDLSSVCGVSGRAPPPSPAGSLANNTTKLQLHFRLQLHFAATEE
ncbi:hypothetical protein KIL84_021583 [Mauremys mutica]|uniref:Uncharacterized protein n=1 Tax=Mauremys mutica TaxID=74926 RepID=A0A9D4AZ51_9SAUR|nr:hypothetical protein KIL84_021583 [Mauremys mutica]